MCILLLSGELAYHGHRVKIFDSNKEALNKVFSRLKEDRHMLQKDGLLAQENFLVLKLRLYYMLHCNAALSSYFYVKPFRNRRP